MNLLEECSLVLSKNWQGGFTIPSARLYPFQWNWDSGFIALGNSYDNQERALVEMETLFSGQWSNGFLPHILFHNAEKYTSYFPSAGYWNSQLSQYAPKDLKTSGITQPPVHGFVLLELYEKGLDQERIKALVEKTIEYHKYLYEYKEYKNTGLVAVWHNWESGMDNSVWWDKTLSTIDESWLNNIELHRKDIHEVEESESTRPKDLDYKRYLYLIELLKEYKYDHISEEYPFQILDPVFNSILHKSNACLIELGEKLDIDISYIKGKHELLENNFDDYLWNLEQGLYFPFDIVSGKQIEVKCSGSFVPLFAGIPDKQKIVYLVEVIEEDGEIVPIPSCFPEENGFEKKNYWRGPVWVNINWMVWKGLKQYGLVKHADKLKKQTIGLVEKYGIYEYFDPFRTSDAKIGLGGAEFSWSAALVIDMLKTTRDELD